VLLTPGHTVGGQSIAVNTSQGKAVITGFCCNEQNFPAQGPVVPSGVHINVIDAYESAQRVKEMADIIIPLHDLAVGRQHSIPA
jgi:N-acyl homoserine lactone hydrolase